MLDLVIIVIFLIPIYGLLIWTYFSPEESIFLGRRWMYREEPELSKEVIQYTKFTSIIAMVGIPLIIISFMLDYYFLRLVLIVGFSFIFMLGILKIFK
ncbi:hypothetical protein [Cytobacillus sp. IB215665]|uniref:hypothetical protein n=1 Tax=Cytobacillus sp. IB215665 TaxID=3097357 RepID=UPI002A13EC68|nr:hypothetical protein [Cytobacillus sp. IB215665]MDX8367933.1 hypothetical protein [Cytobacillus sp. IB215665]